MKSIVVMTYYQLMHSIALALSLEDRPMLYFARDYLKVDDELLERIRETNIFHNVVGMTESHFQIPYNEELRNAYGKKNDEIDKIGTTIFDKYLTPYYDEIFQEAEKTEEIYIYNDFQRHFYYIANNFPHIIGIEDGYKSLEQQIRVHRFKGRHKLVEPFIGKYYPAPLYRHSNVKKIISSIDFPGIDTYYKNLLEVIDFADLIEKNKPQYVEALLHIFNLENIHVKENNILYLGQPMSRALYCTACQNYLYHKKMLRLLQSEGKTIYIKPHPADTLDYSMLQNSQVTILPKSFPLEVLGYSGYTFDQSISFGSTTVVDSFVKENSRIYNRNGEISDIRLFISELIKDERLTVNIYLKAKNLSARAYVNLYGYVTAHADMSFNLVVLVDESLGIDAEKYFALENISKRVAQFHAQKREPFEQGVYELQVKRLPSLINKFPSNTTIQVKAASWCDDFDLYQNYIAHEQFDYFMIADLEDSGFVVMKDLVPFLNRNIATGVYFNNYTYKNNNRNNEAFLGMGSEAQLLMNRMSNVLMHSCLIPHLNRIVTKDANIDVLYPFLDNFLSRPSMGMHVDAEEYFKITDGEAYYTNLIQKVCSIEQHESKHKIRTISMLLYDYYNWLHMHFIVEKMDWLKSFSKINNCDEEIIYQAISNLAGILLRQQKIEHSKMVLQHENFYKYSKDATELLIRKKRLIRAQIWIERKRKAISYLKKLRRRFADTLGEDRTRKMEDTAILRKLYYIVTKKEREVK